MQETPLPGFYIRNHVESPITVKSRLPDCVNSPITRLNQTTRLPDYGQIPDYPIGPYYPITRLRSNPRLPD